MLRINIPAFELEIVEKGKALKKMDAIIGTPKHHTIMFFDQVRNVVFSPYWNIPKSIVAKELWPQILRNRSYLQNNEMEILKNGRILDPNRIAWHRYNGYNFPYLIRQKPGVKNPLGQVKFLFPNLYNIYIHDTPHKELFEKEQRAFSHGCIRIADPRWLAIYLLKEQPHWTPAMIDSAMVSGQELNITLNSPVPVYITYFTAWVDDEGIVHFRDDVYGHDADMQRELFDPNASK
jgi:murein L,D-transpeptidase YcbB/YkuD